MCEKSKIVAIKFIVFNFFAFIQLGILKPKKINLIIQQYVKVKFKTCQANQVYYKKNFLDLSMIKDK